MSSTHSDRTTTGEVTSVARALSLLQCFTLQDSYLTLAELSQRCDLHKTTTLRLARALAHADYLVRRDDGSWRLGPAAGWLGACYQASLDVSTSIEPILKNLSLVTQESATFFVKEHQSRVCLYRFEGPKSGKHYFRIGQSLPLDIGSPGKAILAFCQEPGELYDRIRQQGYYASSGERDPNIASVSAPVYGCDWQLLGVISIAGPGTRLNEAVMQTLVPVLLQHAQQLSRALGGRKVVRLR